MKITKKYVEPKIRFHKLKGERLLDEGSVVNGARLQGWRNSQEQQLQNSDWE